jgi:hypothetical protein
MPLADGDPADDADTWLRVLTEEGYIKKGKIHHSAFTGRAISPPDPSVNRSWSHELSGRLRSLCADVEAEARAFCDDMTTRTQRTKSFAGVMFCQVGAARQMIDAIAARVHFTPLDADKAHADITFTNSTEEDLDRLVMWLTDLVIGLHPSQLSLLPASIGPPAVDQAAK